MKRNSLHRTSNKGNGLGIVLYCNHCRRNLTKDICEETGKSLKQCEFADMHRYKIYVRVPGTKNERKTKNLESRNYLDAVKEGIVFRDEVINNSKRIQQKEKETEFVTKKEISQAKPQLLKHALAKYLGFLHNEGIPGFLVKERSHDHLKNVELAIKSLIECLKENGYNLNELRVNEIDDYLVGHVYDYLVKERKFSNRTTNKYLSYYTSFLNNYIENYNSLQRNWFKRAPREKTETNPETITSEEFENLLKNITRENGVRECNGVKPKRNLYREWLKNAFRLALETGCRREELVTLKWLNIEGEEGKQYIAVENIKVNRIQKRANERKRYTYIPLTESLRNLLNELGYEKYRYSDNYILAPELILNRGRVMSDTLSKAFSHYYDQLGTGRNLTFRCLRKTTFTALKIYMGGGSIKERTGHSDDRVIDEYYIDKKQIAMSLNNFSVFSKESGRKEELGEIRTEKNNQNQQIL